MNMNHYRFFLFYNIFKTFFISSIILFSTPLALVTFLMSFLIHISTSTLFISFPSQSFFNSQNSNLFNCHQSLLSFFIFQKDNKSPKIYYSLKSLMNLLSLHDANTQFLISSFLCKLQLR